MPVPSCVGTNLLARWRRARSRTARRRRRLELVGVAARLRPADEEPVRLVDQPAVTVEQDHAAVAEVDRRRVAPGTTL